MFVNYVTDNDTLRKMEDSKFEFHLTGSQYFEGCGNDVDFFTAANAEVIEFLSNLGFVPIGTKHYGDSNCCEVMRFDSGLEQIDVQIVNDVDLKIRVQETFKRIGLKKPTQEQWNIAFAVLQD